MRTLVKIMAVLLVLAAPIAAPEFFMQQAQAQEVNANGLTDAQQAELDTALEGNAAQVKTQLAALLARYNNNPAVKKALIDAAEDADTSALVSKAILVVTRASTTQERNDNNQNDDPLVNNGPGIFTLLIQNQFLTSNIRTQTYWTEFTILNYTQKLERNPNSIFAAFYQRRIDQLNAQLASYGEVRADLCIGGRGIAVGPYGTVTQGTC